MNKHQIKFYPVGNGDSSLMTLEDGTTVMIDCHFREGEEDTNGNKIFPVKDDLLSSIKKKDGKPYVDLFILTHSDKDHCYGFEKHFHIGKLDDYEKDDQKIVIGELWITSRVFSYNNNKCNDAKAVRREANRRKDLYDNKSSNREDHSNKLRIIGYDGDKKLDSIPHYHPGKLINEINQNKSENFEIFIHAPFNEELAQADPDKNNTSIAFQARFKYSDNIDFSGKAIFSGDADHNVWRRILEETEDHDNEEYLKWDIFLSPHHCSWSFFNNRPYKDDENKEPVENSKKIIGDTYRQEGAHIIASSKLIKDNNDNPPHNPAKIEYEKEVSKDRFKNTANEPNEKKPKPLIFIFKDQNAGFELLKQKLPAGAIFTTRRSQRAG